MQQKCQKAPVPDIYAVVTAPRDKKCGSEHQIFFFLFGRVWKTRRKILTLTSVTPLTHSGGYTANSRALLVGYSDMISHLQCACLQSLHDCHMSTGPVSWWKCPDPIYKRQWGWEVCEKCSLGTNYSLITGCLNYASKTRDTICKTVDGLGPYITLALLHHVIMWCYIMWLCDWKVFLQTENESVL